MVPQMIDGTYRQTNLPDSQQVPFKREELRLEIEFDVPARKAAALRRQIRRGDLRTMSFQGPPSLDERNAPITKCD